MSSTWVGQLGWKAHPERKFWMGEDLLTWFLEPPGEARAVIELGASFVVNALARSAKKIGNIKVFVQNGRRD